MHPSFVRPEIQMADTRATMFQQRATPLLIKRPHAADVPLVVTACDELRHNSLLHARSMATGNPACGAKGVDKVRRCDHVANS
jgi:hypothetical protein